MKKVPAAVICLDDALAFGVVLEAKSRALKLPANPIVRLSTSPPARSPAPARKGRSET